MRLTDDQRTIQQLARDFAESELAPIAARIDQEERIPKEIIEKMAEIGFTALNVPEAYGGPELDTVCKVLVVSELAKKCASTAEVIAVHTLVNDIFLKHGTEAQKEKYLTAAVEGKIGAFALTDPEKGTKGMSAIVVDRGTPGFTVGKREEKLGIRGADISELIFEDCRVPRSNLIGQEGEGFKIAMAALDGGRIGMAAQGLGIADAAIEASIKYMKERVQFGKPIAKLQGLQWYLADMATRTEAARALVYEAACAADSGEPLSKLAAMCKYYASENAVWVTNKALQIHGGYGYMRDYPIERMYRDARIVPIYEGTSEIQKVVISRELLK